MHQCNVAPSIKLASLKDEKIKVDFFLESAALSTGSISHIRYDEIFSIL